MNSILIGAAGTGFTVEFLALVSVDNESFKHVNVVSLLGATIGTNGRGLGQPRGPRVIVSVRL